MHRPFAPAPKPIPLAQRPNVRILRLSCPEYYASVSSQLKPPIMQRAPPSRVKRLKPYARSMAPSSKPGIQGSFEKAHHFTIQDSTFCDGSHHLENFMKEIAMQTIPGAAFDSSERDPPPRCHPGTRLAIIERTLCFFAGGGRNKGLLWIVGPAGVGKSAIMQTLAETASTPDFTLGASLFFSVNGRDDGSKTMATLAYQLAVKSKLYKDFVQNELANDPMLLDKALIPQFHKLIVEPFVTRGISPDHHQRFVILIDGLDECNNQDTQRTILGLITYFCTTYPTAPLIWVVASRPEPHITRFLSRSNVSVNCIKEEIKVDSNQSRVDVERYLRTQLENIRSKYPALDHFYRWPPEHDFLKLATTAGGLFAFARTAVEYIDDPMFANPASQLEEVLAVIDEVRSREGGGKRHPMANLDALYSRIMSKIPPGILNDTKRLLLQMFRDSAYSLPEKSLQIYCNWLGMKPATTYAALHHLHSVLGIPCVEISHFAGLQFHHKSFHDYLTDFERSGMFMNLEEEVRELNTQCALRILDGVSKAREIGRIPYDGILLSWPSSNEDYKSLKDNQYYLALWLVSNDLTSSRLHYGPGVLSALRLIDIRFSDCVGFHWKELSEISSIIFGRYIRRELEEFNALQKMSIGTLNMDHVPDWMTIIMSCRSQHRHLAPPPQPCSLGSNYHMRHRNKSMEHRDDEHYWGVRYIPPQCCGCVAGALQKLKARQTRSPDDVVTTFTDVTGNYGWIYYTFPDSEYPSSTWEFIIPYQFNSPVGTLEYV